MNTPQTTQTRPRHVPTPKMSQRKKDLFGNNSRSSMINLTIEEDSDLGPINLLEYSSSPKSYDKPSEPHPNKRLIDRRLDFSNLMEQLSPAIKNSCRISQSDNSPRRVTRSSPFTKVSTEDMMTDDIVMEKENNAEILLKTPALGNSTTTAPRISFRKAQNTSDCSNGTDSPKSRKTAQRRNVENKKSDVSDTPKAKASLTFGEISAKSFYGTADIEPATKRSPVERVPIKVSRKREQRSKSVPRRRYQAQGRPGARKPILGSIRKLNHKFKAKKVVKVDALKKHTQLLDRIEKVIDSSSLTTYFRDLQANNFDKDLISGKSHNILKESVNSPNQPAMCFPIDLADIDTEKRVLSGEESDQEEQEPTKRKFFKSKSRSTQNRYQVAKGVSATVKRGHGIKLLSPPKKKQKIDEGYDELLSIQKEVQNIVKMLSSDATNAEHNKENTCTVGSKDLHSDEMEVQSDVYHTAYDKFRKLIPYNTTDPTEIKRQETVLEILIENGICHEQNFKIFISEYEQRKDVAELILNNLFDISVTTDMNIQEGMWTSQQEQVIMDSTIPCSSRSEAAMSESSAISNDKREFHPIFYKDHRRNETKKDLLSVPMPKTFKWIQISDRQLQIDAGQKDFGSKNCSECGMFYTLHDPDDEILHQKFHNNMMGVLSFKGWTEENIVENIEEWGQKGRIIWVNKMDVKSHVTRILEILEIINNDLGFANVELRDTSIVYLAISRKLVVGVCVAEPLKEAYSMYTKDNLEYIDLKNVKPVKCGISRVWVTPQFRRYGVATRLIEAVRAHFVLGHTLSSDEIAFSTPTAMGKHLAQSITPNVLVYDQV